MCRAIDRGVALGIMRPPIVEEDGDYVVPKADYLFARKYLLAEYDHED
jgi:hypothetical protein